MSEICIPIETLVREFDGKLWLSANLAVQGNRVAIGDKSAMQSGVGEFFHPDIFITKGLPQSKKETFRQWRQNGTAIAMLDAEGGVFASKDAYYERINLGVLEQVDIVFAWGEVPASVIRNRTSFPEKQIYVTGNPRFDLLHRERRNIYSEKARQFKSQLGTYALVNTNFTMANHYDDSIRDYTMTDRDKAKVEHRIEHQSLLIDGFLDAINQLTQLSELDTVVIRPHPSENHDFYREQFADTSSVVVEHSGDVRPWILGAQAVLHNSCTTGIESAMLNVPVIAFEPDTNLADTGRSHLPNAVSTSATTVDELLDEVQAALDSSEPYLLSDEQTVELEQYFANVEEPATPKMVEIIEKHVSAGSEPSYPAPALKRRVKNWVKQQPIAPTIQRLRGIDTEKSGYRRQKFSGLDIDEVWSRLDDFGEIMDTSDLTVRRVNYLDDVYWIEQT